MVASHETVPSGGDGSGWNPTGAGIEPLLTRLRTRLCSVTKLFWHVPSHARGVPPIVEKRSYAPVASSVTEIAVQLRFLTFLPITQRFAWASN